MSKRALEIFMEVCEQQSMSEAAKVLHLTQPAVSAAVSSLEKEYETKLFVRHGKTLELSEQGRRLRQYADVILEQYGRAWDALHEQPVKEEFRIALNDTASEIFLPSIVKRVMDESLVSFVCCDSESALRMLKNHECDLSIADHNADETGMTYLPLYKEEYVFAASDSYTRETSLNLGMLLSERLLLREKGSGCRSAFEAAVTKRSVEVDPFVESRSDLSLITLARDGAGIVCLPLRLIEKSLRKKKLHLIKVKGIEMKRQYYMIYRSDMHQSEGFQSLLNAVQECAKRG